MKEGVSLKCENGSDSFSVSNILKKNTLNEMSSVGKKYSFNNIEVIKTPKRKNKSEHTVSKLVSKFSASTCNLPGVDNGSESPVKQRRLWGQGGQGH